MWIAIFTDVILKYLLNREQNVVSITNISNFNNSYNITVGFLMGFRFYFLFLHYF